MNIDKKSIIRCPKCGCEYLPAEIFYPDKLLGKPSNIIKDDSGCIVSYSGDSINNEEEFICEHCGCHFKTNMSINISTTLCEDEEINFNSDYISKL